MSSKVFSLLAVAFMTVSATFAQDASTAPVDSIGTHPANNASSNNASVPAPASDKHAMPGSNSKTWSPSGSNASVPTPNQHAMPGSNPKTWAPQSPISVEAKPVGLFPGGKNFSITTVDGKQPTDPLFLSGKDGKAATVLQVMKTFLGHKDSKTVEVTAKRLQNPVVYTCQVQSVKYTLNGKELNITSIDQLTVGDEKALRAQPMAAPSNTNTNPAAAGSYKIQINEEKGSKDAATAGDTAGKPLGTIVFSLPVGDKADALSITCSIVKKAPVQK